MSYSLFYVVVFLLVAVKGETVRDPCQHALLCSDNSVRCLINETTEEWLQDKKFVKMVMDRIALKNVTNVYDYVFNEEGVLKIAISKKMISRDLILPNGAIADISTIRHFMDPEEIGKHKSLCCNENSTAFMLDDDAPAPYNATKITGVKIIKAVDLAKFLAKFRYRIGCSSQETAQLRHVMDLEFCQDNGLGILTTLFIILCACILMIAILLVLVVIASKYRVISLKLF